MKVWEEFTKVAVIGTGSQALSDNLVLPRSVSDILDSIQKKETNPEDKFLSLASAIMNYRKAGKQLPIFKEEIKECGQETKEYCHQDLSKALRSILNNHWDFLLELWLKKCNDSEHVVPPEFIPDLLEFGKLNKKLCKEIKKAIGNRGQWLAGFYEQWGYVFPVQDESLWETGTIEERKELLHYFRENEPIKAIGMLEKTWSQEDLNTKLIFLPYLYKNLSLEDEPFLEKVLEEKSNKTWEEAFKLLKSFPDSKLVSRSWEILSSFIKIDKKKSILPGSKIQIEFNLPDSVDKQIKELNFRLGNRHGYTKEENFLYELISIVPPNKWENEYKINGEKLLPEIQKSNKKYFDAFIESVILHQDKNWACHVINNRQNIDDYTVKLLTIVPFEKRERYILDILHKEKIGTYDTWFFTILENYSCNWSFEFSLEIFYFLAMLNKMPEKKYLQGIFIGIHKGVLEEIKTKKYFHKLSQKNQNSIHKSLWEELGYELEKIIQIRMLLSN